ncbi:MAG: leucyl aminopeptidase [Chitinophagales bacterium]|nr:leucyl aminopeptidase [Chitinophagales bacterium]MDW8418413.1 leucyl aminopeptidase [Chitinophagales bacterium]
MNFQLQLCTDYNRFANRVILISEDTDLKKLGFDKKTTQALENYYREKINHIYSCTTPEGNVHVVKLDIAHSAIKNTENARHAGYQVNRLLNGKKIKEASLYSYVDKSFTAAMLEGLVLSNYEFLKYKTLQKNEKSLAKLHIDRRCADKEMIAGITAIATGVFFTRDLVNEPQSFLTATQLSREISSAGKKFGFQVTVFDKRKITQLGMGGLLAVNQGSVEPPTFTILEYKPARAVNKKPIVLVGKGIVYDTGGLSLKPTPNSMDFMKCDMAGAALVAGTFISVALNKIPVHLIGLVPATDNRPGGHAYAPGDVIKMMSGLNVEMLNSDAEGRMILADALHYAKQYKPELVMDFATLTGAAKVAFSHVLTPYMGTADEAVKKQIEASGDAVYERLLELPLYEEYGEMIKSDLADIKNIGGPEAGAITAAKFLEHFTDYPWLHFDIAGTAYITRDDSYRGKYATGIGVRLLTHYLKNYPSTR